MNKIGVLIGLRPDTDIFDEMNMCASTDNNGGFLKFRQQCLV